MIQHASIRFYPSFDSYILHLTRVNEGASQSGSLHIARSVNIALKQSEARSVKQASEEQTL